MHLITYYTLSVVLVSEENLMEFSIHNGYPLKLYILFLHILCIDHLVPIIIPACC